MNISKELFSSPELNTGDIILCHGYSKDKPDPGVDGLIEIATHSPWEHAAIIIKDPTWIDPSMVGLYVYQSGWGPNNYGDVLTGDVSGTTLNHFSDFVRNRQHLYLRSISNVEWSKKDVAKFKRAFKQSHSKPYDSNVLSWAGTGCGSYFGCPCISRLATPKETETFWCSALVSFMYCKMGWFSKCTDWSCKTPEDLAVANAQSPYQLGQIWLLKK